MTSTENCISNNSSAPCLLNESERESVKNDILDMSDNLHDDERTNCNSELASNGTIHDDVNVVDISESNDKNEWVDVLGSGCLLKKIIVEGETDSRPQRLQKCLIDYKCTLENGTLVENVKNLEIHLGDADVVQGLDLAIGLMNVKEKCKLKIESRLAYGSKGLKPTVPSDATVYFDVELLSAEPEDDPETLTVLQRKLLGNRKRERGNWWYTRGENTLAIQCYRRSLNYLDEVEGGITEPKIDKYSDATDAELQDLLEDRISVCNNMAAAQIKLELYDAALNSLQTVLMCQPDNIKALFRKAKVHRAKNDISAAIKCLQKASSISPDNADVQKELNVLDNLFKKQKTTERELARRMFNGPKVSPGGTKNKKRESNKLFVWATVGASVAVGLVGLVAYRFKFT